MAKMLGQNKSTREYEVLRALKASALPFYSSQEESVAHEDLL